MKNERVFMQVFSADATNFLCLQKVEKKTPSKVAQNYFLPIADQTAQTEEFMFQNVAYRPTVYRTGAVGHPTFSNCVKSLLKIC